MKTFAILIVSLLFLIISSCTTNSDKEISSVVDTFFRNYKTDFRTADKTLLTQDLSMLIDKAIAKEIFEAEKTKKSNFPSDKPLMIEGDIFTSLYEGQNSFKIGKIKTEENRATVTVQFKNTLYKETWEDQVLLIKEKYWKIDNVIFKGKSGIEESTKKELLDFIDSKS